MARLCKPTILMASAYLMIALMPANADEGWSGLAHSLEERAKAAKEEAQAHAEEGTTDAKEDAHEESGHMEEEAHGETSSTAKGDGPVFLLGGVAFIMGIFYFVNERSLIVRRNTWVMLNLSVSIFCAVLYNSFFDKLGKTIAGMNEEEDAGMPPSQKILDLSISFFVWWVAFAFLTLYFTRNVLLQLKGWGTIGGHIIGFAAIALFVTVCDLDAFKFSHWGTLLVILIFVVTMSILLFVSKLVGGCIQSCMDEEEAERWHEQSAETAVDFFCLCAGFLICLWVRFLVLGFKPPLEDHKVHSPEKVLLLWIASLVLLVLSAAFSVLHHSCATVERKTLAASFTNVLAHCFSNAAAYTLLYALAWSFARSLGHTLMSKAVVAFLASVIAMAFILVVSMSMHVCRGNGALLRGVFLGLSLCVGLSWEHAFDGAVEALTDTMGGKGTRKKQCAALAFSFALFAITFPAWMAYILPKADEEVAEKYKGKSLPWYAAWCVEADEELSSEEDDDEDSDSKEDLLS